MIQKISLHLALIWVLLFGNITFCFSAIEASDHMVHMSYSEVHDDCCPTHNPSSGDILSVLEVNKNNSEGQKYFVRKSLNNTELFYRNYPFAKQLSFVIQEHPDRQSFFFVDTIRLLI